MRYQVGPESAGIRLGQLLFDRLKLSRSLLRRAKQGGAILVDGQPTRTSHVLRGGELVEVMVGTDEGRVSPEPLPLVIRYEDEHLLVVEKPAGMVVHPVRDYVSGTLANGVAYHLQQAGLSPVARPVQRIDRETSGLVLFAKEPAVAGRLARELERQKMERYYLAVVESTPPSPVGTIDVPIRRVWGHPVAREAAVGPRTPEQEAQLAAALAAGQSLRAEWTAAGQRAVTHWQVLRTFRSASLLRVQLETGRTHQIRVHMAHLGHPLLGDELYGHGGPPGRQALHAAAMALTHPVTGVLLRFASPLPPDLVALLARLEEESGCEST